MPDAFDKVFGEGDGGDAFDRVFGAATTAPGPSFDYAPAYARRGGRMVKIQRPPVGRPDVPMTWEDVYRDTGIEKSPLADPLPPVEGGGYRTTKHRMETEAGFREKIALARELDETGRIAPREEWREPPPDLPPSDQLTAAQAFLQSALLRGRDAAGALIREGGKVFGKDFGPDVGGAFDDAMLGRDTEKRQAEEARFYAEHPTAAKYGAKALDLAAFATLGSRMGPGATTRALFPVRSSAIGFGAASAALDPEHPVEAFTTGAFQGAAIGAVAPVLQRLQEILPGATGKAVSGAIEGAIIAQSPVVEPGGKVGYHGADVAGNVESVVTMALLKMLHGGRLSPEGRDALKKQGLPDAVIDKIEPAVVETLSLPKMDPAEARRVLAEPFGAPPERPVEAPAAVEAPKAASEAIEVRKPVLDVPAEAEMASQRPVETPVERPVEAPPVEPPRPETNFAETPSPLTSIKNRTTNDELAARGLPPLKDAGHRPWSMVEAEARKIDAENPNRKNELAAEIVKKPRALEDWEDALLDFKKVELNKAMAKADAERDALRGSGEKDKAALANDRALAAEAEFIALADATKSSGTIGARGLAMRAAMAAEDYTLGKVRSDVIRHQGGEPLSEAQRDATKALSDALVKSQARVRELESLQGVEADPSSSRRAPAKFGSRNRFITTERYEKTMREFRERNGLRVSAISFLDPANWRTGVEVAAYFIEGGARKFSDFVVRMKAEFGDDVDPHLRRMYADAKKELSRPLTDQQRADRAVAAAERSIERMEGEVEVGDVFPAKRQNVEDPRLPSLRAKQAELRQRKEDMRESVTRAEDDAKIRRLDEVIKRLESRAERQDVFPGRREKVESTNPDVRSREARVKELRTLIADIAEAVRPRESESAVAAKARLTRVKNATKEIERRIAEEDYAPKKPKPRAPMSKELVSETARLNALRQRLEVMKFKADESQRTLAQKVTRAAVRSVPELLKAIKMGVDFSIFGLQMGQKVLAGRFREVGKALREGGRSFASEQGTREAEARVALDPLYHTARREGGVKFGGHGVTPVEELARSTWAEKVPGLKHFQRGVTAALNSLRMQDFARQHSSLSKGGRTPTTRELAAIGNATNVFTGRGGPKSQAFDILSNPLVGALAPRWVMSRFQTLLLQPMWGGSARTRKIILGEYVRTAIGAVGVYAAAIAAGAEIDNDPESPTYGMLDVGGAKIDPLAGLLQAAVFLKRLGVLTFGDDEDRKGVNKNLVGNFVRTKLAPIPGAAMSRWKGKTIDGREATPGVLAGEVLTPLGPRDVVKAFDEHGFPEDVALSIMSLLGIRVRHNEEKGR